MYSGSGAAFHKIEQENCRSKMAPMMHPECPYYSLHPLFTVIHRHPRYSERSKMAAVDNKIHPYEDTRYIENSDGEYVAYITSDYFR